MPSTYTLNNGIELIATGEQSGTWGDTTNTNLELLDTALDGQVTVTLASAGTSGSPNTLPISDGAASNGRNRLVIFNDGVDLGATAYVQLTPNDAEKIIYVRNSLSGSRSILLFQGTYNASNDYEIPAGTTAIVYFNGGGAGAVAANVFNNAYFDSLRLGSVSVTAIIDDDTMATASATNIATSESIKAYVDTQVGANNELSEVLANGNTTGGTDISVSSGDDITFADSSKAIFGAGSDLQIYHDGANSIIYDAGTGNLQLASGGTGVDIQKAGGEKMATFAIDGAATLYYDNSAKLTTTSTGIDVTGTVTADGLTVDTNTLHVDATNNRVGIGTSSPAYTIDASSSGNTQIHLKASGQADGLEVGQLSADGGSAITATNNNYLKFGTNNTERMRITSSGSVGIGVTPSAWGSAWVATQVGVGSTIAGRTTDYTNTNIVSNAYFDGTNWRYLSTNTASKYYQLSGNHIFDYAASGTSGNTLTFSEAMRIDSSGNVGIGTSSPDYKLEVEEVGTGSGLGGIAASTATAGGNAGYRWVTGGTSRFGMTTIGSAGSESLRIYDNNNSAERMRIDSSGNVGIGTSSPASPLHLNSASDTYFTIGTTNATADARIQFRNSGGTDAGGLWYATSSNSMQFRTNSSERMRIDSSGNLQLTSVNQDIEFNATTTAHESRLKWNYGGTLQSWIEREHSDGSMVFGNQGAERMRIDNSGNVGIGTTSPSYLIHADAATATDPSYITASSGSNFIVAMGSQNSAGVAQEAFIGTLSNDPLKIKTNNTERMRIDSSGNLLVGRTTTEHGGVLSLNYAGATQRGIVLKTTGQDGANAMGFSNTSSSLVGTISVGTSSTSYNTSSDYRLKENVTDVTDGITRVKQLEPRRFNFIAEPDKTVDGFLAHEAQAVVPEAVTGTHNEVDADGNAVMQGIDQSKLVPLLTAALKEAITKIETLETEMTSVKARLDALEGA